MTPEQVEAILESNSKAIASNTRAMADYRKHSQGQIDALYNLSAELMRDRTVMFNILRSLNDDRVRTSENLATMAENMTSMAANMATLNENVSRIAEHLEQREG